MLAPARQLWGRFFLFYPIAILGPNNYNWKFVAAGVAQLVEHLICNQRVGGSNPFASSMLRSL